MSAPMRVLLIEDDPEHVDLIKSHISRKHGANVRLQWADRLSSGIGKLENEGADVILLDLGLPDSSMDQTLSRILPKAHGTPVVVLSSLEDEEFGIKAVHQGAQDYISKSWMDGELLVRSLRYAIERKTTEEELRKANQAKDEFLTTISHELRTPIGVIQGFAEILSEENSSEEERKKALDAIRRNARIQVSLINDMLDMSRIMTGKLSLQSQPQDLHLIINDAVEAVNLAAKNKNIKVNVSIDPFCGPVLGDQVRLHQIMWNLLSNAVKFTPMGGSIEVRLQCKEISVEIDVEDSGEGIDSSFLPFVFDRFRQQDGSLRRQHGGLGLGLAIVKHLVELHGGRVFAKSEGPGRGATFTLSFPLLNDQNADDSGASASVVAPPVSSRCLEGLRILAIDDSEDTLMLLKTLLQKNGAAVTTARSGAEARRVLDSTSPHLIVCDIEMPGEDGYAFVKKLRAAELSNGGVHIPAVALTAYTREEDKLAAFTAGFQVHLSKPIDERMLIRTLEKWCPR